jgi:deoxyribose-phosphate aldolase
MYTAQEIAKALDYAVLKPTATEDDIHLACQLVLAHGIRTICVAPIYAHKAVELGAPVCAVVGFTHGK